jgi:DNA-binding CsgD family transcriptional regulator
MAGIISERLSAAAARSFVGRHRETAVIAALLDGRDAQHSVVFVHGPGGTGKTHLVRAAISEAPEEVVALVIDCREVEPAPDTFLDHLSGLLGGPGLGEAPDPAAVAEALGGSGTRVALVLDAFETFGLLDSWLRSVFLPLLPDHVVTIIAGREPPRHGWRTAPGWGSLVAVVELGPLPQAEAMSMLRSRGVDELHAARINRYARGYPLAIELAATAGPDERAAALSDPGRPSSEVMADLLAAACSTLDPPTRELLEAASVVRRVNEPILRALLPDASVRDAYEGLAGLPFVERRPQGLLVHDVIRDAFSRDLAERDPEAYARHRAAAARHFQAIAREAAGERLWEVTADLVYMVNNPYARECCFPTEANGVSVERAAPSDGPAIRAIARAHEPPAAAELTMRWWERHPEAFHVARSGEADVAAFHCLIDAHEADPALLAEDPVAARWADHMDAHPLPSGRTALLLRRWLGGRTGELPSPEVVASWLSLKREYMERRPGLARLYSAIVDLGELGPIFVPLGFGPCGEPVALDGTEHVPVMLDFGPGSVDGWLSGLIDAELAEVPQAPPPAPSASLADLSPREREVLVLLADGASNRQIGERLVISDRTAGRHVANIFAKLGIHTRAEAARIAAEHGLTAPAG